MGVGLNIIINSVKLDWLIKRHICKFGHTQRQKKCSRQIDSITALIIRIFISPFLVEKFGWKCDVCSDFIMKSRLT